MFVNTNDSVAAIPAEASKCSYGRAWPYAVLRSAGKELDASHANC